MTEPSSLKQMVCKSGHVTEISYDPPHGSSFFGPVISSVPGDDESLALYDALRTLASYPDFAEVKRTKRPPLDLPLFTT